MVYFVKILKCNSLTLYNNDKSLENLSVWNDQQFNTWTVCSTTKIGFNPAQYEQTNAQATSMQTNRQQTITCKNETIITTQQACITK